MNITAYVRLGKRKDKASIYFRVRDTNPDCDLKAASEFSINPAHWDSRKMGYKFRVTTISDAERLESHTARKTFVGNLYKIVKDPNLISSMSGHANGSRAFARYRAIDDDIKLELIQHMK